MRSRLIMPPRTVSVVLITGAAAVTSTTCVTAPTVSEKLPVVVLPTTTRQRLNVSRQNP